MLNTDGRGSELRGRRSESKTLDGLLADARKDHSGVVVLVRGEAGVGRPRCWTTLPSAPMGFGSCARSGLSRRWSSHTPACTNSARHCSTASRTSLRRSAMRCPRPLASAPVSRRTGSWSGWRCSAWCPRWPRDSRCSRSSTTHSGSTESPRRRLGLWPGGCWPNGRCWHSVCGTPSGEQELAGLPELVVTGLGDGDARALLDSVISGPWISGSGIGSWRRRAAIRWPCWSCHAGSRRRNWRSGLG